MQHASQTEKETAEIQAWSGKNDGVEQLEDNDLLFSQSAASLFFGASTHTIAQLFEPL